MQVGVGSEGLAALPGCPGVTSGRDNATVPLVSTEIIAPVLLPLYRERLVVERIIPERMPVLPAPGMAGQGQPGRAARGWGQAVPGRYLL